MYPYTFIQVQTPLAEPIGSTIPHILTTYKYHHSLQL